MDDKVFSEYCEKLVDALRRKYEGNKMIQEGQRIMQKAEGEIQSIMKQLEKDKP